MCFSPKRKVLLVPSVSDARFSAPVQRVIFFFVESSVHFAQIIAPRALSLITPSTFTPSFGPCPAHAA